MIEKYKMIKGNDNMRLTQEVNDYIALGYQPYGDPVVFKEGMGFTFFQALVKIEDQ